MQGISEGMERKRCQGIFAGGILRWVVKGILFNGVKQYNI